jgi:hypothetical protein
MQLSRFCCAMVAALGLLQATAQPDRWQQRISYQISADLNVTTNIIKGKQQMTYWNNSPDTLHRLFIHLYWNAFQPNSSMDVRSRELGKIEIGRNRQNQPILDWDGRVKDRISKLTPDQIGYQKVSNLTVNGKAANLIEHETILEVVLATPLLPKSKSSIQLNFEAQVPIQIRRSGRDNAEGIRYSMSQWYPKLVEYDYQGWNANPYIAREFYGVWGDYDVKLTLDKTYLVAATGTLQNPLQTGFGYQPEGAKLTLPAGDKLTWHFTAQNVHDFVWAADPTYKLIKRTPKGGGPLIYVVYKAVDSVENNWQKMADTVALAYPYIAKTFGPYPHKNYSFIQGGDGGMEYPMATLIKNASIGTAIHEWMHSWYQMMLGTNESLFSWMDEGFTSYAESRTLGWLRNAPKESWLEDDYGVYYRLQRSGLEEPLSTHADHFNTNYAYSAGSYGKGAVFLAQLGYIIGEAQLDTVLLAYYNTWRFKHPNVNDFVRVAEKISGMELDWYKEYWVNSIKFIDYGLGNIEQSEGKAELTVKRIGKMPMPIDIEVTYKDGTKELYYIPLNLMYGNKPIENTTNRMVLPAWRWTHPEYQFKLSRSVGDIKEIVIDPTLRLADVNKTNNKIVVP